MTQRKEDTTISMTESTPSPLPTALLERMNALKEQHQQVELFTADLDLLVKRYHVEQSLFGKAALRFSALYWWQKGLAGLIIGSVFSLIGLGFSTALAITFPLIALTLYCLMTYLFYNYTSSDKNRFTQISQALIQREEEMKQSVLDLQSTEKELYILIDKLNDFDQHALNAIHQFKEQIDGLEGQVKRYEQAASEVEQLQRTITEHALEMKREEGDFATGFNQITQSLSQQLICMRQSTARVNEVTRNLNETIENLDCSSTDNHATTSQPYDVDEGFVFRNEEELKEEQEAFKKADLFLKQTDEFIVKTSVLLMQNQVVMDSQHSGVRNKIGLN